ncbi:MAG TPA: helix-turn-helix domain-containing protein [Myxococcota bacterium]|nr:helix-turn-helix domain-containing protein [Myxococcota bacterium]
MPRGLLPTGHAAAHLGLSPRTLERWRVLGTGPVFRRLGRAVRYSLVDLEAFAATRMRVSTRDRSNA